MNPDRSPLALSSEQVGDLFPFHVVLGPDLRVRRVGRSFARLYPNLHVGESAYEVFVVERPRIELSYKQLLSNTKTLFVLSIRGTSIKLRGQMLQVPNSDEIAFLCSPWLPAPGSLRATGLTLEDFPLHDAMPDLALVVQSQNLAMEDLRRLTDKLKAQKAELQATNLRIQAQIRETRKLALIASRTDNGVVITDASGKIEWINEGFIRITGFSLEECLGRSPGSILQGPASDAVARDYMRGCIANGESFRCEIVNYRKTGEKYWVAIEGQPVRDEAGLVANFLAIESDITARKAEEARNALARSVTTVLAESIEADLAMAHILALIGEAVEAEIGVWWKSSGEAREVREAGRWFAHGPGDASLEVTPLPGAGAGRPAPRVVETSIGRLASFALPIQLERVSKGTLEFFMPESTRVSPDWRDLLTTLSSQIGQFLERRESEAERDRVLSILNSTLDSSTDGILVVSMDRSALAFNRAFLRMAGFQKRGILNPTYEQVLETIAAELLAPEEFAAVIKGCIAQPDLSVSSTFELKNGRVIAFDTHPQQSDGKIIGRIWIGRDITEQFRASAALRESEERYRVVAETASDGILTIDAEGSILFANDAAGRIFGYKVSELAGMPLVRLIPEEMREAHLRGMGRYIATGVRTIRWQAVELVGLRKDGSRFPLEVSFGHSTTPSNVVFTGIMRDITERKKAEAALQRATRAAEAANRAKSDFLANMSHEIRTPLNAIIGMTDLLKETPLDGEQRDMLQTVWTSSESLLHLISDILDISKIEAGQVDIDSSPMDIAAVCEDAIEIVRVRAARKNLELYYAESPGPPPRLRGDAPRIRQVLVNLLTNAIKFTARGSVRLALHWQSATNGTTALTLTVEDTGIGLSEEECAAAFEKFFRVDSEVVRRAGGAGLGLSISKLLVEAMGGAITVASTPGRGSRFSVHVQLHTEAKSPQRAPSVGLAILIADPDRSAAIEETLQGLKIFPSIFSTPQEAADALPKNDASPVLLVVDAHTPMEQESLIGLSRLLALREKARVLIAGASQQDMPWPASARVPVAFLPYPITPQRLVKALENSAGEDLEVSSRPAAAQIGASVLLVEDNPDSLTYAARVLTNAGCRVTPVATGADAFREATKNRFDVILMDVMLPDGTGFEVTRKLRAEEARTGAIRTPVLALTAHALQEYREQAFDEDMDDYLTKPIRAATLRSAVEKWASPARTILVVSDEGAGSVAGTLFRASDAYRVLNVEGGEAALAELKRRNVAAVLMERQGDQSESCAIGKEIRAADSTIPLIAVDDGWPQSARREWQQLGGAFVAAPLKKQARLPLLERLASPSPAEGDEVVVEADMADLIPGYLQSVSKDLGAIRVAAENRDAETIRKKAHNLAGSGGAYGFSEIRRVARAIESCAKAATIGEVFELVGGLERYLANVRVHGKA